MTTAACNLQRVSKMLRINLFFSSNVNTSVFTDEFPNNLALYLKDLKSLMFTISASCFVVITKIRF